MSDKYTDLQLDQMLDQGLAFERDLQARRVWVTETLAVEPTPRGEWVVADYSEEIKVLSNTVFATREEAWEFATR